MPEALRTRGTHMYGLDQFGKGALTNFISDLDSAIRLGFTVEQCSRVKTVLNTIREQVDAVPPDTFLRRMWTSFVPFQEAYGVWNERDTETTAEAIAHRRKASQELKRIKDRLYRIFNEEQLSLQDEFDFDFVDQLYLTMEELVHHDRGLFPELEGAINRWRRFRPASANPNPQLLRRPNFGEATA